MINKAYSDALLLEQTTKAHTDQEMEMVLVAR